MQTSQGEKNKNFCQRKLTEWFDIIEKVDVDDCYMELDWNWIFVKCKTVEALIKAANGIMVALSWTKILEYDHIELNYFTKEKNDGKISFMVNFYLFGLIDRGVEVEMVEDFVLTEDDVMHIKSKLQHFLWSMGPDDDINWLVDVALDNRPCCELVDADYLNIDNV